MQCLGAYTFAGKDVCELLNFGGTVMFVCEEGGFPVYLRAHREDEFCIRKAVSTVGVNEDEVCNEINVEGLRGLELRPDESLVIKVYATHLEHIAGPVEAAGRRVGGKRLLAGASQSAHRHAGRRLE